MLACGKQQVTQETVIFSPLSETWNVKTEGQSRQNRELCGYWNTFSPFSTFHQYGCTGGNVACHVQHALLKICNTLQIYMSS